LEGSGRSSLTGGWYTLDVLDLFMYFAAALVLMASVLNRRQKYETALVNVKIVQDLDSYERSQMADALQNCEYAAGEVWHSPFSNSPSAHDHPRCAHTLVASMQTAASVESEVRMERQTAA
jgi:hypothetical protein